MATVILHVFLGIIFVGHVSCDTFPKVLNVSQDEASNWTYCNHPDCSIKNQHTLCIAVGKQSPRLFVSGMTNWMRFYMLQLHNRHRDTVALGLELGQPPANNMRKMYWDAELEKSAEVWARQCQMRHDECRNTIGFNVLQNMDVRPVAPRVTQAQLLADAVGAWFSGSRALPPENVWSFKLSNCSGGCNAHWYSTAAWGSTWRLGCSQALCTAVKDACSVNKKKRQVRSKDIKNMTESVTINVLLRRTRYTTAESLPLKEFGTSERYARDSPLHRGVLDAGGEETEKEKELNLFAYTFCNYGPAGNVNGFPMYEAGTPCSNCPQGTKCGNRNYRGLCALVHDPDK